MDFGRNVVSSQCAPIFIKSQVCHVLVRVASSSNFDENSRRLIGLMQ